MSHTPAITKESIIQYLLANGGKVSNKALVKHFKKALKGSENAENRTAFTALVGEVVTVWKDKKGRDYLHLREEFSAPSANGQDNPNADQENQEPGTSGAGLEALGATAKLDKAGERNEDIEEKKEKTTQDAEGKKEDDVEMKNVEAKSDVEGKNEERKEEEEEVKTEMEKDEEEKPAEVNVPFLPNQEEVGEEKMATDVTDAGDEEKIRSGSVLQKAKTFDALEEAASPAKILRSVTNEDKCICASSNVEEEVSISNAASFKLDDVKRKWMIMCAKCDYQAMARLLQDHHHLAGWKNFVNGYSALHFAAKFGDTDCIKLLAGAHKVNVNSINNAGMTPLHLSALHNQGAAIRLLVETYKADPNIRDYRGKLAKEYLNESTLSRSQKHDNAVDNTILLLLLSEDNVISRETEAFLKDNTFIPVTSETMARDGGTLKHGDTTGSGNSILRRSFRVGTHRALGPTDTHLLNPSDSVGTGMRKGSYGRKLTEKQKEAMVTRSMSETSDTPSDKPLPKNRGGSMKHLRQQNRVVSMVDEIPEEPSDQ